MNAISISQRSLIWAVLLAAVAIAGYYALRQYRHYRTERDALGALTPDAKNRKVKIALNKTLS